MRALLDTHTLLWWLGGDERLSAAARVVVGDEHTEVYVSAASAWEIATRARLGKLPGGTALIDDFAAVLAGQGFRGLPIGIAHALRAGSLAHAHRDPFDRMLISQSFWRTSR